jgi:hypothetical protein
VRPPDDDPYEETRESLDRERRRRYRADATLIPPLGWVADDAATARRRARVRVAVSVGCGLSLLVGFGTFADQPGLESALSPPSPLAAVLYGLAAALGCWLAVTGAWVAIRDDLPDGVRWKVVGVVATQLLGLATVGSLLVVFRPPVPL